MRFFPLLISLAFGALATGAERPHLILVMADDLGWGQTGYRDHPLLETPHLDAMAANGLRLDRFYAANPVCSPTRASVLTGRSPFRCGVPSHGHALRHQERTLPEALNEAGYATGHFGKWHLDGFRGPGVPILPDDPFGPGTFGFDTWLSVTNFFDRDPILSREGEFEEFVGDSSEIIVREALDFIEASLPSGKPTFSVIWYGSPHDPFVASEEDRATFARLPKKSAHHHGEILAMDRSLGTLRAALRRLGIEEDTLLVFCSDNGGLRGIEPPTTGGLRGHKGTLHEGGLRVPAVIEWPGRIEPRVSRFPSGTVDLFPTIAELLEFPDDTLLEPIDGISLVPLFEKDPETRPQPLGFRWKDGAAWTDDSWKLVTEDLGDDEFRLYDLENDPAETTDLRDTEPERFAAMKRALLAWNESVEASVRGADYAEGRVDPDHPKPRSWIQSEEYAPFLDAWRERPEYRARIKRGQ